MQEHGTFTFAKDAANPREIGAMFEAVKDQEDPS
jgi:hypothetical protein